LTSFKIDLMEGTDCVRFGDIPTLITLALHPTPGDKQDACLKFNKRHLVLAEREGRIIPRMPMSRVPCVGWDIGEFGKQREVLVEDFEDYLTEFCMEINWVKSLNS